MKTRTPGRGALEVPALDLECMGMSFAYGPPREKQAMIKIIRTAAGR